MAWSPEPRNCWDVGQSDIEVPDSAILAGFAPGVLRAQAMPLPRIAEPPPPPCPIRPGRGRTGLHEWTAQQPGGSSGHHPHRDAHHHHRDHEAAFTTTGDHPPVGVAIVRTLHEARQRLADMPISCDPGSPATADIVALQRNRRPLHRHHRGHRRPGQRRGTGPDRPRPHSPPARHDCG